MRQIYKIFWIIRLFPISYLISDYLVSYQSYIFTNVFKKNRMNIPYTCTSTCKYTVNGWMDGNPLSQNFGGMTVTSYYFRNCD